MHINRLDIDRKNSAEHLQVGPLSNGLNAIYAPIPGGSDTLARFVRTLLFRGNDALATFDEEFHDCLDGSMQWVDASGHVRMMSTSSGVSQSPNRFLHSPLHPSERPIHADDSQRCVCAVASTVPLQSVSCVYTAGQQLRSGCSMGKPD